MTALSIQGLVTSVLLTACAVQLVGAVHLDVTTSKWQTWGPYRPGLYFGVRPMIPETLLMGVMWANGSSRDSLLNTIRDTCEQDDGVKGYGWTMYDPRGGGTQVIQDAKLGVNLMTEFVKNEDGSGWAVQVSGEVRPDIEAETVNTSLIFHVAMEGAIGSTKKGLVCERLTESNGHISGTQCRGKDENLGSFDFRINADPKDNVIKKSAIRSKRVDEDKTWQAKSVFMDLIKADDSKDEPGAGNLHFVQFDFEGPFSATFSYRDEGGLHISPDSIVGKLHYLRSSFTLQVGKVFQRTSPFRDNRHATFSEALLSNLLGGLGFFHGDSKVDISHATKKYEGMDIDALVNNREAMADTKITTTKPTSLLSFTPSRPFFPRGFLWDEGFHLLPVIDWDIDLAIVVLRSWLEAMDKDGWIAREQILGPEARSRVPEKFQVQYPHHANPPTLLALVLPALLSKLTSQTSYNGHPSKYVSSYTERTVLLRELYPLLSQHYLHFRSSQAGNFTAGYPRPEGAVAGEGYRWRGRTAQHTLPSGLDDYPRAAPPSPSELHVDALAWVGASARALLQLAEYLMMEDDASVYRGHLHDIEHNLDALHWDETQGMYCDATVKGGLYQHVCHLGYVSVLPLLLGLVNASHPHLPAVLDSLSEPDTLWSEHGLRSLSAGDKFYGTGEDYWRGKVWMNINVLAVLRLRDIGLEGRPESPTAVQKRALEMAAELRRRVVSTVYKSWAKTGFVWEQYEDTTGEGKRSKGFTGWTACVLLLMGLEFARGGKGSEADGAGSGSGPGPGPAGFNPIGGILQLAADGTNATTGRASTQAVFVFIAALLVFMICRRRLFRQIGRVVGYWQSRSGGRARHEEVIDLRERQL